MVVNGGVAKDGKLLSDTWFFNCETLGWFKETITGVTPMPIAYHKLVFVADSVNSTVYSPFQSPELLVKNTNMNALVYRGVYSFGGLTTKRGERSLDNTLRLLRVGQRPIQWNILKLKGKPPEPRKSCGITYCENFSCLAMFGGETEEGVVSDFWLFDLSSLQYMKVYRSVSVVGPRAYFGMECIEGRIFIFGGANDSQLCSMRGKVIEMSMYEAKESKNDLTKMKSNYSVNGLFY